MFERHRDYVTSFTFKFRSRNEGLNQMVQNKMSQWFKRRACDQAQRHSFQTCIRLAEASALTANDCLAIKLANGRVQWIEGDRINNPGIGLPPNVDPRQLVTVFSSTTTAHRNVICRNGPKENTWQDGNTDQHLR